ncbi:MAG: TolC family protein, partial [Henriciella sp.]|uniref:TolC family protein n=1 Tax=Henriciella sp. TaxID=1968823 RepID=UPI003C73AC35
FSRDRIRAGIRAADAREEAALATYEKAVIVALNESEQALNSFVSSQQRFISSTGAVERQREIFALAERRYEGGEDDRLALERARIELIETDRRAIAARSDVSIAAIATFKALGGGWLEP